MSKEGYGSMVRVVPIQAEDIPANEHRLIELFEQSFRVSFAEEELGKTYCMERVETLRSYLGEGKALLYAAKHNDDLVGIIWFFVKEDRQRRIIHINHFVVAEEYRGKGIGGALFNQVEDYAISNGIAEIELLVSKDNHSAVAFYKNRDFETKRLLMTKRLF